MTTDPSSLYFQIGSLIQAPPDLSIWPPSSDTQRWLGQAVALVQATGEFADVLDLKYQIGLLGSVSRSHSAVKVMTIIYRALAIAEQRAPVSVQSAFIPVGHPFDAMVAVGKVIKSAESEVMIVDPYMDEKVLNDFAIMADEGLKIRLLTDSEAHKASLRPAVRRWNEQFSDKRPLEVRVIGGRMLHDRLIAIDQTVIWILTQSLNAMAARSPASITRCDPEVSSLKLGAFESIWSDAQNIET